MEFWVPLLSALAGALIGSATSIVTMLIQAKKEDARHRRETAVELALAEHSLHIELARAQGGRHRVLPITAYVAHHLKALKLADKGELTVDDMATLERGAAEINAAFARAEAAQEKDPPKRA